MGRIGLVNDGANASCLCTHPGQERNAGAGHDVSLDREQVADLVNREIQEWQTAKPEEDEACLRISL